MLLRTVSDDSVRSSGSLKMGNVTRDDSLKEEENENEPEASTEKDDKIPEDKVLTAALDRADKYEDDPTVEYYDIFISYRRSRVGEARALYVSLQISRSHGKHSRNLISISVNKS